MKYSYVKTKSLPFLEQFLSLFSLPRPEATRRLQNPQSISPSQAYFVRTQTHASAAGSVEPKPLSHSSQVSAIVWETGSHPGSWHKLSDRSQNGPQQTLHYQRLSAFLTEAVSTIKKQHIYFNQQFTFRSARKRCIVSLCLIINQG